MPTTSQPTHTTTERAQRRSSRRAQVNAVLSALQPGQIEALHMQLGSLIESGLSQSEATRQLAETWLAISPAITEVAQQAAATDDLIAFDRMGLGGFGRFMEAADGPVLLLAYALRAAFRRRGPDALFRARLRAKANKARRDRKRAERRAARATRRAERHRQIETATRATVAALTPSEDANND